MQRVGETLIALQHGFCRNAVFIVQQMIPDRAAGAANGKELTISTKNSETAAREQGAEFMPRFDAQGLAGAIVQDEATGEVLMFAFMDAEAIAATRETGLAHFHSRSRGRLWKKGETSGHVLEVCQWLVDCDQDAFVLKVRPHGPACHTGMRSCFYRQLGPASLTRLD